MRIIIIWMLLFCSIASATEDMQIIQLWTAESISGSSTITSTSFPLTAWKTFGIWVKATSASSTPALRVYYETSYDDDAATYAIPDRAIDIWGPAPTGIGNEIKDENIHQEAFSPPPMAYVRIRIVGISTPADTLVTVVLIVQ